MWLHSSPILLRQVVVVRFLPDDSDLSTIELFNPVILFRSWVIIFLCSVTLLTYFWLSVIDQCTLLVRVGYIRRESMWANMGNRTTTTWR